MRANCGETIPSLAPDSVRPWKATLGGGLARLELRGAWVVACELGLIAPPPGPRDQLSGETESVPLGGGLLASVGDLFIELLLECELASASLPSTDTLLALLALPLSSSGLGPLLACLAIPTPDGDSGNPLTLGDRPNPGGVNGSFTGLPGLAGVPPTSAPVEALSLPAAATAFCLSLSNPLPCSASWSRTIWALMAALVVALASWAAASESVILSRDFASSSARSWAWIWRLVARMLSAAAASLAARRSLNPAQPVAALFARPGSSSPDSESDSYAGVLGSCSSMSASSVSRSSILAGGGGRRLPSTMVRSSDVAPRDAFTGDPGGCDSEIDPGRPPLPNPSPPTLDRPFDTADDDAIEAVSSRSNSDACAADTALSSPPCAVPAPLHHFAPQPFAAGPL